MLVHQSFSLIQEKFWSRVSCLHAKRSLYGNFLVHVWSHCGGLNKKYCISVHWGSKSL